MDGVLEAKFQIVPFRHDLPNAKYKVEAAGPKLRNTRTHLG